MRLDGAKLQAPLKGAKLYMFSFSLGPFPQGPLLCLSAAVKIVGWPLKIRRQSTAGSSPAYSQKKRILRSVFLNGLPRYKYRYKGLKNNSQNTVFCEILCIVSVKGRR